MTSHMTTKSTREPLDTEGQRLFAQFDEAWLDHSNYAIDAGYLLGFEMGQRLGKGVL